MYIRRRGGGGRSRFNMLIRTLPLLLAVTLSCVHAGVAQDVFSQRRFVAASGDSASRARPRAPAPRSSGAAANAIAAPPPSPPPPPPEPSFAPHRFAAQQRAPAPAATSTAAPPRPTPSPPPPPPRFRLPEQEEAAPPLVQRLGPQARGQPAPSGPSTTAAPLPPPPPPPPPPQALRSRPQPQPAEAAQPAVPTHRFAHERTTPKPLPAPAVLPQQPARKPAPDVVTRSGDGKSDAALEEERRRQAESAQYSFGSSVQDSINDNVQSREETRDGLKTVGSYSYSDGFFRRTVHYEADDKGYRVVREETETIGNGPQVNLDGRAEVESNVGGVHNKYAITLEDIPEQQP